MHEDFTLFLLILALGSVAEEGYSSDPCIDEQGRDTGVRGGTLERPPGHVFLCEAKRRLGISSTVWNLGTLQCYILLA